MHEVRRLITNNFEYHQPFTAAKAIELFQQLDKEGKSPVYFNGGTEIITMLRINAFYNNTQAVINIRNIPECNAIGFQGDHFIIGGSITLAHLEEREEFPLLRKNCGRIADHTSREKITIAGNICGSIMYKEAILPLLLTDATLLIMSELGIREVPIHEIFDNKINLDHGTFIVQIAIKKSYLNLQFVSKKITKIGRIGYPVLTVNGLQTEEKVRFAFSGLCAFPFRSYAIEKILNSVADSFEEKLSAVIKALPAPILDDAHGSSAYREFVLRYLLEESLTKLKVR